MIRGNALKRRHWAGPLDKNGETFYAISPTPAGWTSARIESQYREDNSANLRDITAHEAMPGHYLQGSHASQAAMPTLVRAMTGSGTFIEGWAVYAEQFMAEAGWGGDQTRMGPHAVARIDRDPVRAPAGSIGAAGGRPNQ